MKVFYKGRRNRTNAIGEYNLKTGELVVKKGSVVSETVAEFKGAQKVRELRKETVNEKGVVLRDVSFKKPSPAAVFVSGYSANGMLAWHVEQHKTLQTFLREQNI